MKQQVTVTFDLTDTEDAKSYTWITKMQDVLNSCNEFKTFLEDECSDDVYKVYLKEEEASVNALRGVFSETMQTIKSKYAEIFSRGGITV